MADSAGIRVRDAAAAFSAAAAHGATAVLPPTELPAEDSSGEAVIAEIRLDPESDVVLRFVSGTYSGPFLPGYQPPDPALGEHPLPVQTFGIRRVDHIGLSARDERRVIEHLENTTGALWRCNMVCCKQNGSWVRQSTCELPMYALQVFHHSETNMTQCTCSLESHSMRVIARGHMV